MNRCLFLTLALLFYPTANPVLARTKLLRTITVTGQGVERIPTTLTNVSLGVEVQGKTASGVQQEAARQSSSIVRYLRAHQVEKLETTGIRLNPICCDNNNSVQHPTGYSATNTVSFRVNSAQAGTVLDEAVKAGATKIDSVSFVASDIATSQAQQQALQKAAQDAQRQADAVLGSLHLTRQEVVSIQVNGTITPQPLVRQDKTSRSSGASTAVTPVIGGEQEVDAAVTLQISY